MKLLSVFGSKLYIQYIYVHTVYVRVNVHGGMQVTCSNKNAVMKRKVGVVSSPGSLQSPIFSLHAQPAPAVFFARISFSTLDELRQLRPEQERNFFVSVVDDSATGKHVLNRKRIRVKKKKKKLV